MYAWIWRHLPGQWPVKLAMALGLAVVFAVVLWYLVFPWLEPKIQFDQGTVQNEGSSAPARP